jgi:hypothetical protein
MADTEMKAERVSTMQTKLVALLGAARGHGALDHGYTAAVV